MPRVSKHFAQSEFDCKCGCNSEVVVSRDLIDLLEGIRVSVGDAIKITSGARCENHNRSVGGASESWHLTRNHTLYASDITYWDPAKRTNADILRLYVTADRIGASGLGLYSGRIHVDKRLTKRARWSHSSWNWDDATA
jgi:hypothetical protein